MSDTKLCVACAMEIPAQATKCHHCQSRQTDFSTMHRDQPNRLIGGVCAALARQLSLDVTLVRVFFAVAAVCSGGLVLGVYLLIWLLTPRRPGERSQATRFMDAITRMTSSSTQPPTAGDMPR